MSSRAERFRHVAWAVVITALIAFLMLLKPVDWMAWTFQSRLGNLQPSGSIVYVQAGQEITDSDASQQRLELARALDRLRREGASRVYLDFVLPAGDTGDAELRAALARWGSRLYFVDRIDIGEKGSVEYRSAPSLAAGHPNVWSKVVRVWPNLAWDLEYSYPTSAGRGTSFASSLANRSGAPDASFAVNYGFRSTSIPQASARDLARGRDPGLPSLAGKSVVIGTAREASLPEPPVPGQVYAPTSFVPIYAAETLMRGPIRVIPGVVLVPALALLLLLGASIGRSERRRWTYAAAVLLPGYLAIASLGQNIRVEFAYCAPLLLAFALFRWRANWQHRVASTDFDTGLPSLRALAADVAQAGPGGGYVVVAKIHAYETLLRSLDSEQRATYVLKLVERLRVGDGKLPVHIEGQYLAWLAPPEDPAKLYEHLEGLRAIFAAPVSVGNQSVDVGITFGAAPVAEDDAERSLASALAAVEETDEAIEPIKLAETAGTADSLWDLSLRSRIDAAMEAGEVFCVYQPQFDIRDDRMTGVEALVRWEDPDRGFIPPLRFIMQCEKAGRMEYLTRYVLQCACSAANLLHFRGQRLTMSVNISATLLNDMRIVGIVRNVLQATGFDPHYLMLEITETARIRDLAQARAVLRALKALGTRVSIDDFGVGAANFETLDALPFDEIKIDRQFVSQASTSPKARAIAASIVDLGKNTRIAVIAEGAETATDLAILSEIGCHQVQGFALSKPMPLTKLLNFLEGQQILSTG